MSLTSSQRSKIRGLAMTRQVDIHIGKAGVSASVLNEIDRILTQDEVAKVRFETKDREWRDKTLAELVSQSGAEIAGTVGFTASIYRYSPSASRHLFAE